MRHLLAGTLLLLLGCGGKQIAVDPVTNPNSPPPFLVEYSMQAFSSYGFASACAAGDYIYTAKHVLIPFVGTPMLHDVAVGYAWSDHSGRSGTLDPFRTSPYRDIAVGTPAGGMTPYYRKIALAPPQRGDRVWWVEYNKTRPDNEENYDGNDFFAPVVASAKVERIVAGHVTFDTHPTSGASGTCLVNDAGEVVGIVMWGFPQTGVAVLLTPPWGFE